MDEPTYGGDTLLAIIDRCPHVFKVNVCCVCGVEDTSYIAFQNGYVLQTTPRKERAAKKRVRVPKFKDLSPDDDQRLFDAYHRFVKKALRGRNKRLVLDLCATLLLKLP